MHKIKQKKIINNLEPRTIFSASLKDNIFTLNKSIPQILRLYPTVEYYLICKEADKNFFHAKLPKDKRIFFISEESLIPYDKFSFLFKKIAKKYRTKIPNKHLSWYYQQALKLTFILKESKNSKKIFPAVMFDADSIPLKKINFFSDANNSILYGSLSERHLEYFKSLDMLFGPYKYPALGFTTQFFSITFNEMKNLKLQMKKKFLKCKNMKIEELVTYVLLESTLITHGNLNGSKFSEQELVGVSNFLNSNQKKQIPIFSFRSWVLTDVISSLQMKFLSFCGVSLVTYENRIFSKLIQLSWHKFLFLFISDIKPQAFKITKLKLKHFLFQSLKKEKL